MDLLLDACTRIREIALMFFIDTNPYLEVLQLSLRDAQKFIFETENEDGKRFIKRKLMLDSLIFLKEKVFKLIYLKSNILID
jgi:hypothetical protein